MSASRLRPLLVALVATAALGTGAGAAAAAPQTPAATPVADFPFDGQGADDAPAGGEDPAERAERLGGNVAAELIDLLADVVKCGLNVATPSVECPL